MEKQKLSLDKQAEIQIMKADDIKGWKQTTSDRKDPHLITLGREDY